MENKKTQERKECEFLEACGFNLSNGFFSEDVKYWKDKEPELFFDYVTNGWEY